MAKKRLSHHSIYFLTGACLFGLILSLFSSCGNSTQEESPKADSLAKVFQDNLDWVNDVGAKQKPTGSKVYFVNDAGAKPDGTTLNTSAIQRTIDKAAAAGGGIVRFKQGSYVTGSVFLKSGVTLEIDKNVQILGSQDIKDYKLIKTRVAGIEMEWPAALINVLDQQNVAIEGEGLVDGRGKVFWDKYWAMREVYEPKGLRWASDYDCKRPRLLLISNSSDVTLSGLRLQRSGFWTVHVLYSHHITVDGVQIKNNIGGHGPSTDGIDIDSSTDILVENCDVDCNDDNYCMKAGRDADGLRVNRPTKYVVIRNCIARAGSGLCTFGSETSGSIHYVLIENSKAIGTSNGIKFKSAFTRGGTVSDIYVRNISLDHVKTAINLDLNWNPSYSYTSLPDNINKDSIPDYWKVMLEHVSSEDGKPTIQDIYLAQIKATNCNQAIFANGMETSLLKNIYFDNIDIAAKTAGKINYAGNWHFQDVSIKTEDNSHLSVENSKDMHL